MVTDPNDITHRPPKTSLPEGDTVVAIHIRNFPRLLRDRVRLYATIHNLAMEEVYAIACTAGLDNLETTTNGPRPDRTNLC